MASKNKNVEHDVEKFSIELTVDVWEDERAGCYVSHCPELDHFSHGSTRETAIEALKGGLRLLHKHTVPRARAKAEKLGEMNEEQFSSYLLEELERNRDSNARVAQTLRELISK